VVLVATALTFTTTTESPHYFVSRSAYAAQTICLREGGLEKYLKFSD
jgi:hypothetical protein